MDVEQKRKKTFSCVQVRVCGHMKNEQGKGTAKWDGTRVQREMENGYFIGRCAVVSAYSGTNQSGHIIEGS